MDTIVLKATDLDGYLTEGDRTSLDAMDDLYGEVTEASRVLSSSQNEQRLVQEKQRLIDLYNQMGDRMQEITAGEPAIKVYSFQTPPTVHGEASRLIAKLRDVRTQHYEFVYYIQRAYELLFQSRVRRAG